MHQLKINKTFEKRFGEGYKIFRAPGRINLIGEHTDYNLGFVMPGAIDRYIYLAIKPNGQNKYRIISDDYSEEVEISKGGNDSNNPSWANYPKGIIKELENKGFDIPGFDAVFGGDIPLGAGLSSSAALEMAFSSALNMIFGLKLDDNTLARVGQLAEHNTVGVKCGIMDQFASLFGRKNKLIRLDCRDLSYELTPFSLDGYSVLLADTCVKHSLASSAYNKRREECEEGVKVIAGSFPEVKSLRDVTLDMINENKDQLDPVVAKRCEYVVEENTRVIEITKALDNNNINKVGELLYGSHYGLKNKYEVSCDELDFLVEIAEKTAGVEGARMMGGGFGGCTINLMKTGTIEDFKASALEAYTKKFAKEPHFYEVKISDGAGEYNP